LHECSKKITEILKKKAEFEQQSASIISKVEEIIKKRTDLELTQTDAMTGLNVLRTKLEDIQEEYKKHELEHDKARNEMSTVNAMRKKLMSLQKNEQNKLEHSQRYSKID
jgi:hypothetical protein